MGKPLGTILAAVDLSYGSEIAGRRAADLAKSWRSELLLVYVLENPFLFESVELVKFGLRLESTDLRTEANRRLRELAARIGLATGVTPKVLVAEGRADEQVAAVAADVGAGLVVVGAHGRHVLLDVFVGATAQRILQVCPVPVLMVRQAPYLAYGRVLVATDCSAGSIAAAGFAREHFPSAELCLVHAYELALDRLPGLPSIPDEAIEACRREADREARERLERFAREAGLEGPNVSLKTVYGHASSRVLELAREWNADLVIAGARGLSGLKARLLGSVGLHLVLESRVDVLVVNRDRGQG